MTGQAIWVWIGAAAFAALLVLGLSLRGGDSGPGVQAVATGGGGATRTTTSAQTVTAPTSSDVAETQVTPGAAEPTGADDTAVAMADTPKAADPTAPAQEATAGPTPETGAQDATQPNGTAPTLAKPEADTTAAVDPQADAADAPRFDLVRVDPDGGALVAGRARPGSEVTITVGGDVLETLHADETGAFVGFVSVPDLDSARPMRLREEAPEGPRLSAQTVLIVPPTRPGAVQPTVVVTEPGGTTLLQPSEPEAPQAVARDEAPARLPLALDTISYDDSTGDVVLAGRGAGEKFVRVYMDNVALQTQVVPQDGSWQVTLPDVAEGTYTLRVDQISPTGTVLSRVESPFRREAPAAVAAAARASADRVSVTVQPGNTLWALAEARYGDGVRYVQIFEANRGAIRNPDLIYPGQIFDLPDVN